MIEKTRYIPDEKGELKKLSLSEYTSNKLFYPLINSRFSEFEAYVNEGDFVFVGQVIGKRKNSYAEQNIHSTVSGKVLPNEKHFDSSGKLISYIAVENDNKYALDKAIKERSDNEIAVFKQQDFVNIMKEKSLVGLGGGAFPTYIKFDTAETIDVVVGNGVECEPYLVSDYFAMKHQSIEMLQGMVYAMQAVNAPKGVIAIKAKYDELYEIINELLLGEFKDKGIFVQKIGNYYPQGWELEVIKNALGVKVPQGELPSKYGVINVNVTTLVSIYHAVKKDLPVLNRYFVVSGDGVSNAAFNVRVGSLISELVVKAGGYVDEDKKKVLIIGGPMMGSNVINDDIVISPLETSLIVLNDDFAEEMPCLRCASCVYSCPVNIQPVQIMNAFKTKDKDMIKALEVDKCIGCGLCSYTCPSKIHLTEYMRLSKKLIR